MGKEAESQNSLQALQASETRYRRLFETAQDGILILNAETGEIDDVNPYMINMLHYSHEEFIGMKLWEVSPFKDTALNKTTFEELQDKGYIRYKDLPLETKEGKRIAVEFVSNVYKSNGDKVIQCNIRNTTKHKRLEEQQQLAYDVLNLLNCSKGATDTIGDIMRLIKKRLDFEAVGIRLNESDDFPYYVTDGFSDEFVRAEKYLCARNTEGKIVRDEQGKPVLECMCGNILCGRTDAALPFFTEGGSFWTNSTTDLLAPTTDEYRQVGTRNRCNGEGYESVALIALHSGDNIIGLLQLNDPMRNRFTLEMIRFLEGLGSSIGIALSRMMAKEKLLKAEGKYRSIFENVIEGIFQTTPEGRFLTVNPSLVSIYGYSSPEEMIETVVDIGRQLYVNPDERNEFVRIIQEKGLITGFEAQLKRKDGNTLWVSINARCAYNENGKLLYYEGTMEDITNRKHLESQLFQSQKMEAIGTLAGGVAHDFNNILTAIMGFSSLLQMDMREDDPKRAFVDQILISSEKAANLTHSLLAFSRKQEITLKPLDINNCVKETSKLLKRLLTEDIELKKRLSKKTLIIMGDATQIDQILINLAVNAHDAMPTGGTLSIETEMVILDDEFIGMHGYGEPGKYVLLSVSDTGIGMDEATKARIFDPFFTTKEIGKGTGLGLSTVYGIVKQHNGYITVYSEHGHGTTFRIYLPSVDIEKEQKASPVHNMKKGSETILMAEDDPGIRNFTREILQRYGYTIIEAADGEEAVSIFMENRNRIDLIILDVVMPGKNGKEVYDEIVKTSPDMKFIFTSGYTGDVILDKGIMEDTVNFISKPLLPDELLKMVRDVLDE